MHDLIKFEMWMGCVCSKEYEQMFCLLFCLEKKMFQKNMNKKFSNIIQQLIRHNMLNISEQRYYHQIFWKSEQKQKEVKKEQI